MSIEKSHANVQPQNIAEELLGTIKWIEETRGYCNCPGDALHKTNTGDRDCIVYLNGVATIHCVHQSCISEVQEANRNLRKAIIEGAPVSNNCRKPSSKEINERVSAERRRSQLELRGRSALERILKEERWVFYDITNTTPDAIPADCSTHWKEIVGMFRPGDVIWIGDKWDSGASKHAVNFLTQEEWLKETEARGPLTCPAVFKENTISRKNENVLHRRFLVVESDVLSKNDVGAVFRWLRDEVKLTLRAVVDTAGKSLHGWFEMPKKSVLEELEIILPQLGCDPGLFTASQPCRMPGALRDGKYQRLVYLNKTGKARAARMPRQVLPLPELYYDGHSQCYWRTNDYGAWQKINESSMDVDLMAKGFDGIDKDGLGLTEVKQTKRLIQVGQDISFAGPLAGYASGVYTIQGQRILVTTSPKIIVPKAGTWPTLDAVITGLLNDGGFDQREHFYGWMKVAYKSLTSGVFTPGQALCLAGPKDCGKSLLQLIITEILGGRSAKPYDFLTKDTTFNADIFAGEHLMIEDNIASTDIRARRNLGAGIKEITVNTTQRCHAKGKNALMLTPFWRLSLSVNDEPENLLILPPLDDSLLDKMMIFKAKKVPMPLPTETPEQRKLFLDTLFKELPAFIHFLENWEIPDGMRSQRFGVSAFQHPTISDALKEAQPEKRLLSIIDEVLFPGCLDREVIRGVNPDRYLCPIPKAWEGSAEKLEALICNRECSYSTEARKLLYYTNACGSYLGRLRKMIPGRIESRTIKGYTRWVIHPPIQKEEPTLVLAA